MQQTPKRKRPHQHKPHTKPIPTNPQNPTEPYPNHARPTPDECLAVRDELLRIHGFPVEFREYRNQRQRAQCNGLSNSDDGSDQNGIGFDGTGRNGDGSGQNGNDFDGSGRNLIGFDGSGRNGNGFDESGQNGSGLSGSGRNGIGFDGSGQNGDGIDGSGQNGNGLNGSGRNGDGFDGSDPNGIGFDGLGRNEIRANGSVRNGDEINGSGQNGDGIDGSGRNDEVTMSVLDGLVSVVISQNTTDVNSQKAFGKLKSEFPTWEQVLAADSKLIEDAIRCGGLAPTKASCIKNILACLMERRRELSLEYLRDMSVEEIKAELSSFKGIGPKTVACVLMFHLQKDDFPVDTHIFQIAKMLGWVPAAADTKKTYLHLNRWIPDELKFDLNCLLFTHGKVCSGCAIRKNKQEKKDLSMKSCPLLKYREENDPMCLSITHFASHICGRATASNAAGLESGVLVLQMQNKKELFVGNKRNGGSTE
ncbi:putative DNA glycosylase [Drosera capensis]